MSCTPLFATSIYSQSHISIEEEKVWESVRAKQSNRQAIKPRQQGGIQEIKLLVPTVKVGLTFFGLKYSVGLGGGRGVLSALLLYLLYFL